MLVNLTDYPQLALIAWGRLKTEPVEEAEALALYERNWAYVDKQALQPREAAFLEDLVRKHGNGCFAPF